MCNVRVIFDRVTVSLKLFLSSTTWQIGLRSCLKRVKYIVTGSDERYKGYSV